MAKVVKRSDSPLGPKLKRMREAAGISPADHAKAMGVTSSALSQLERRGSLNTDTLSRYMDAMGGRVWLECGDGRGPAKWEWL